MKRIPLFLFASVALFIASCGGNPEGTEATVTEATTPAEAPAATDYTVDTQNSLLTWKGSKVTGSSHEGTLKLSAGTLKVEGGNLVAGSFTIDMNSLDNTDLKGTDGYAIEQQTKRLSQVTDAFAARRLDSTVKAALAGRNLNEIEE